jgi:hypothetical protein
VTWAHRRWRGLSESWTKRSWTTGGTSAPKSTDDDMDILVERTNPISWSCCIVIPRAVWDDLGGFDERFRGWGFEDMALQSIVVGLYGHERIAGDVYHLWHPIARRSGSSGRAGADGVHRRVHHERPARSALHGRGPPRPRAPRSAGPESEAERHGARHRRT